EREGGEDEHDKTERNRGLDNSWRQAVGQELPERNGEMSLADDACGFHIFALALGQDRAAHQAGHTGHLGYPQGENEPDGVPEDRQLIGLDDGGSNEVEQDAWKRQPGIDDPHQDRVQLATVIARDGPQRYATDDPSEDRQHAD